MLRFSDVVMGAAALLAIGAVVLNAGTAQAAEDSDKCDYDAEFGYWECRKPGNTDGMPDYYEKYDDSEGCNKVYYHPPFDNRTPGHCDGVTAPALE